MGIFSWLRFRKSAAERERTHSLVRYRYEDPKLEELERDVAADVAEVEEGAKHRKEDTSDEL